MAETCQSRDAVNSNTYKPLCSIVVNLHFLISVSVSSGLQLPLLSSQASPEKINSNTSPQSKHSQRKTFVVDQYFAPRAWSFLKWERFCNVIRLAELPSQSVPLVSNQSRDYRLSDDIKYAALSLTG